MGNGVTGEIARFALVGALSSILNYAVFFSFLSFVKLDYIASSAIGYVAGVMLGFSLNRGFTFRAQGDKYGQLLKYAAVYIFSLLLGLSTLKWLVTFAGLSPMAANILTIGITAAVNFWGSKFIAFQRIRIPAVFYSRAFIAVLALKIIFSLFFGSDFIVRGTIPFIDYFVTAGFANPYDHFLAIGQLKAFPYSTTMLLALSIPAAILSFLPQGLFSDIHLQLLLARLPLIAADIGIFLILLRLLKTKEHEVLLYYWCSPIVFYITYFHGQLDGLPTFLLLLSVYFLLTKKHIRSALALGVALSAKANIIVALPFIFLYLWRNRELFSKIAVYFALALGTYAALVLPFIFSQGYQKMVIGAEEQWLALALQAPFGAGGMVIYIVPLVLFVFFLRLTYFRGISQDALMMSIAVAFTILVSLVPSRPGWFFWAMPFLAYFFVKDDNISKKNYWAINGFFLAYFLLMSRDSDLFASLQPLSVPIANLQNPYHYLASAGLDASLASDFAWTLLVGVMLVNIYFVYKFGVLANLRYSKSGVRIGISGDSGSGKSYAARLIGKLAGKESMTLLEGDDLHKWERGSTNWEKLTHLNPQGNFLHREVESLQALGMAKKVMRAQYDHSSGKFAEKKELWPKKFILVSGLHSFYLTAMRQLLDIKVFMDTEKGLMKKWKIRRDTMARGYSSQKVVALMKSREGDARRFLEPQKKFADLIVRYSASPGSGIVPTKLSVSIDNRFDASEIVEKVQEHSGMHLYIDYNDDLCTQTVSFAGKMDAGQTAACAYGLVPELEELLENRSPEWEGGLDGALQLVVLWLISQNLKARKADYELR